MLITAPWRAVNGYPGSDGGRSAVRGVHADRASVLGALWEIVTAGPVGSETGPDGRSDPTAGLCAGWRVRATPDDVRDAWDAWLEARDSGAPADRVQDLRDDLDRLARAVAQQRHEDVRALAVSAAGASPVPVRQPQA